MGSGQQTGKHDTPIFTGVSLRNAADHVTTLQVPAGQSVDQSITLPPADGTAGQIPSTDGAGNWKWINATVVPVDSQINWNMYEEFLGTATTFSNGWTPTTSGTGAAIAQSTADVTNGRFGVCSLSTGTTTTGLAAIQLGAGTLRLGASDLHFVAGIKVPTLSNGTNRFIHRTGIMDVFNGTPNNGVWFEYTDSSSTFYQLVCKSGGIETRVVSTYTVVAGTWDAVRFDINAAGTSVLFTIDGASLGTITTNIPTTTNVSIGSSIIKTVGTTARTAMCDFITTWGAFSVTR